MEKMEFIRLMDQSLKPIRQEYGLTQDKMAGVLGLSKKTLVEIEKRRSSLGWSGSVVLTSLFSNSRVLIDSLGSDVSELVSAIAFRDSEPVYPKTLGGKVFWKTVDEKGGYTLQQNLVSHHYRLLDPENRRRIATFRLDEIRDYLNSVSGLE